MRLKINERKLSDLIREVVGTGVGIIAYVGMVAAAVIVGSIAIIGTVILIIAFIKAGFIGLSVEEMNLLMHFKKAVSNAPVNSVLGDAIRILTSLVAAICFVALSAAIATAILSIAGIIAAIITIFATRSAFLLLRLMQKQTKDESLISVPLNSRLLKITKFLYSTKTQENVFLPLFNDWLEEYSHALSEKEFERAKWLNNYYTYAFLAAMWKMSPMGDLIEFIKKIAK